MTTFIITRDCCTSGNCFACTRVTPFGEKLRVEQFRTTDKALASQVAENWKQYHATIQVEGEAK